MDLFFSPNFPETDSPEYHSYLFFMSLEGTHMLTAEQLQSFLLTYFQGLAEERAKTMDSRRILPKYLRRTRKIQRHLQPSEAYPLALSAEP